MIYLVLIQESISFTISIGETSSRKIWCLGKIHREKAVARAGQEFDLLRLLEVVHHQQETAKRGLIESVLRLAWLQTIGRIKIARGLHDRLVELGEQSSAVVIAR